MTKKSRQVNFCPRELILKLLAQVDEWHQNLSEDCISIDMGHYEIILDHLLGVPSIAQINPIFFKDS